LPELAERGEYGDPGSEEGKVGFEGLLLELDVARRDIWGR
jgi:hypothetical protein